MQIEVLTTSADVLALKPEWDRLYEKALPGLFIHHSWVYNNYRLIEGNSPLLLAVYGDNRQLIGIFPFAIRAFRIKQLRYRALTHGNSAITDYALFMIDPQSNRRLMIKRIVEKLDELQPSHWDFIKIDNLSDADDDANLFRHLASRQFYARSVATEVTPIIDYSFRYEEAKKISNIKRRFAKLTHDHRISHTTGGEIDKQTLLDIYDLQQKSRPHASFNTRQTQDFYQALMDDSDFCDHVCLSSIYCGESMIAAHFGFTDRDNFYYYVPAYDEAYATYGPGQYLLWQLINRAHDEDKKEFNLLRGSERYKYNWTNKISTNHTLFGTVADAGLMKKSLVNLWLLTKNLPFFA